ncbi:MAG TPA: hypothetical protein V6D00_14425 [Pantanalinema sp.]
MAEQASFARDLGYLDKFLAGLKAHAQGLSEPQRAELLGLLEEEVARWGRIKGILGGGGGSPVAAPSTAGGTAPAPARDLAAGSGWTVGSLMPRS